MILENVKEMWTEVRIQNVLSGAAYARSLSVLHVPCEVLHMLSGISGHTLRPSRPDWCGADPKDGQGEEGVDPSEQGPLHPQAVPPGGLRHPRSAESQMMSPLAAVTAVALLEP